MCYGLCDNYFRTTLCTFFQSCKQVLFDIYVLDSGTSAPRSSSSFYFNQAPVANKINKKKRYRVSFLKSSLNLNPKMKLCTNQRRTSLKFLCLCFEIENETRCVFF